jgi:hypothetical protein
VTGNCSNPLSGSTPWLLDAPTVHTPPVSGSEAAIQMLRQIPRWAGDDVPACSVEVLHQGFGLAGGRRIAEEADGVEIA